MEILQAIDFAISLEQIHINRLRNSTVASFTKFSRGDILSREHCVNVLTTIRAAVDEEFANTERYKTALQDISNETARYVGCR